MLGLILTTLISGALLYTVVKACPKGDWFDMSSPHNPNDGEPR
jgi:hypothetical protein